MRNMNKIAYVRYDDRVYVSFKDRICRKLRKIFIRIKREVVENR